MPNNFLSTEKFSFAELRSIVHRAKAEKANRKRSDLLDGRSIALVFFDPSLRTRASMQVAIYELGGNPVILEPGTSVWTLEHRLGVVMDGDKTEHLKEFVRVLDRYVSGIGVRVFAQLNDWEIERTDPILGAFADHASVPVINLESAMHHPCQSMADMMTIGQKLGSGRKKVLLIWAWHPKPLPMAVPNSFALAAAQFGHDLRIAHPPGYELDEELTTQIAHCAAESGGSLEFTNDPESAFDDVEVVYTKSWGSREYYGRLDDEKKMRAAFREDWIVNQDKMERTDDAIFMHCLPVRRNVIVTDGVIDSPRSVVVDQAENRLHIQKAVLAKLFGP